VKLNVKKLRAITSLLLILWTPLTLFAQTPSTVSSDYLSLETAMDQFLRKNLSVEAARLEVGVAQAERIGARLRPRPGLTISAENLRLSGETPAN
jgi:hypothetical protein